MIKLDSASTFEPTTKTEIYRSRREIEREARSQRSKLYRNAYIYKSYLNREKTMVNLAKETEISGGRGHQIVHKINRYKYQYIRLGKRDRFLFSKFFNSWAFLCNYDILCLQDLKNVGYKQALGAYNTYRDSLRFNHDIQIGTISNCLGILDLLEYAFKYDGDGSFDDVILFLSTKYKNLNLTIDDLMKV